MTPDKSYIMPAYGRLPLSFTHGKGAWLYDGQGRAYLDAVTGVAVCGLGHAHPEVTQAIQQQASQLLHCSNHYQIPLQEELGEKLCTIASMETAFFCNSGSEANETALKLARRFGHEKQISNPHVIVMERAFHGRTMATLSASGNRRIQAGFEPLLGGFIRAPFNDLDAIRSIAKSNPQVVAVMLEPVQGEGGINPASQDYMQGLRQLCDQQGWLLILDEIQSGNGRTGHYFAYQDYGILPDVVSTAKGLGNGVPIGCCLAQGLAARLFRPGNHGSTFGGNPLASRAGLAVVNTLLTQGLCDHALAMGDFLLAELRKNLIGREYIVDVRGKGMMLGIEMDAPCAELSLLASAQGLLINVTAERVIRLLPPLNLQQAEAEQLLERLTALIRLYAGDDRRTPRIPPKN